MSYTLTAHTSLAQQTHWVTQPQTLKHLTHTCICAVTLACPPVVAVPSSSHTAHTFTQPSHSARAQTHCGLASSEFHVKFHTGPIHRGQKTGHFRLERGGLTSKGTYPQSLSWSPQDKEISTPTRQNLKVYTAAFTGFSHVNHPDPLLSQGRLIGTGEGAEPLMAQVQLVGHPAVTSSP